MSVLSLRLFRPAATRGEVEHGKRDHHTRTEAVPDRREDPRSATEKEHGTGRAWQAYRSFSGLLFSKIERGKLIPTLPTLLRIAMVFSVGLEFFFDNNRNRHLVEVIRKSERKRFPEHPGSEASAYWFESLDFKASERKLNSFYAEFVLVAADKLKPHQHPGIEVLFIIEGTLGLKIGGEDYERWTQATPSTLTAQCRITTRASIPKANAAPWW